MSALVIFYLAIPVAVFIGSKILAKMPMNVIDTVDKSNTVSYN